MTQRRVSSGSARPVVSPCVNICKMEDGVCIGCYRTLEEIGAWAASGDTGKRLILAAVAQRRSRRDPDAELVCNCSDG